MAAITKSPLLLVELLDEELPPLDEELPPEVEPPSEELISVSSPSSTVLMPLRYISTPSKKYICPKPEPPASTKYTSPKTIYSNSYPSTSMSSRIQESTKMMKMMPYPP